jgi:prephenate dehydrogenase/chorismate mutase/prephenate dehydrogenase
MASEDPTEFDAEIARLLARRIARLAEAGASSARREAREAGLPEAASREGVPAFLWRAVEEGTAAAAATSPSHAKTTEPRRVTIVGKRGVTGSFFAARLEAAGHEVSGFGRAGWGNEAEHLLVEADLVIVSVPVERTVEIIGRAAPHMRLEAVLADVTSVKTPAFRAMMDSHPGPVVGLHPMFGPGVESFLSQTVVVCHGRGGEAYRWLLDLIEDEGGRLVVSTPEEHDRIMVAVQAIRHFSTLCLGRFLAEEGVDLARSREFASPIYRLEADFVGRMFAQDAGLYVEIMLATPERREAIGRLASTYARLAEIAERGDRGALVSEFERAREALGPETARSLEESNRVIEAFGRMLARGSTELAEVRGGQAARDDGRAKGDENR